MKPIFEAVAKKVADDPQTARLWSALCLAYEERGAPAVVQLIRRITVVKDWEACLPKEAGTSDA